MCMKNSYSLFFMIHLPVLDKHFFMTKISQVDASELLLHNFEEMLPLYYMMMSGTTW